MPAEPGAPLKLLLLDDHAPARIALEGRLAERSNVLCVASTEALAVALAAVEAHTPHAVLVDTRRQDGQGLFVLAQLARIPITSRPLIAVHTAFLEHDEWLQARRAGAHVSILKLMSVDALIARLEDAVRSQLPRERWPRAWDPAEREKQ
jgi:DNA-binding NarL/FixJ family response regulator